MKQKQALRFLLTDLSYSIPVDGKLPIITLYGKTNEAEEVLVKVRGFTPYFYVKRNPDLRFVIQNDPTISRVYLRSEQLTLRRYFWGGEEVKLVKLYISNPQKIKEISAELEKLGMETFETDIPFLKRFLLDNALKCLNVIEVKNATITRRGTKLYVEAHFTDLSSVPEEALTSPADFYPLKLMGLTIKVARKKNESLRTLWEKKDKPILAISIIYGTATKPDNGKVFFLEDYSAEGERKMIREFLSFIQKTQPDILCTFQGDNFDLPYLLHRMKLLRVPSHPFAMFEDAPCYYSKQLLSYRMRGRMVFDLALRTWGIHPPSGKKGLYDISHELLGRGKLNEEERGDVYYYTTDQTIEVGMINTDEISFQLWQEGMLHGKKESLKELAKRCLYDCKLVYDLFWELGMSGWIETLRVTGFPPAEGNSCTERLNGEFELMRYMRRKGIIIPKRPNAEEVEKNRLIREQYPHEGGTVLYPKGTLHTGVLIADFQSMYPSVMIAQNIGGETLKQWIAGSDYGDPKKLFDKQSRSCLSIMEESLIKKRLLKKKEITRLKKLLNRTSEAATRRVLKERIAVLEREQNSMKIVANSMYGAHFYIRSRFYTQTLASAIADSARAYLLGIEEELERISETFVPCELIYGDTDSAFIKIHDEQLFTALHTEQNPKRRELLVARLMHLANNLLKKINAHLPPPVELKFEDVAYRIIFKPERKKAYAYFSLLSREFKIKGFESVRSDWSPLARMAQRKVLEILLDHPKSGMAHLSLLNEFQLARRFLITLGAKVLQMPSAELLPKVVILSPIRRPPEAYKGKTPAVVAFQHYAQEERLESATAWMDYDKFPWVIIAGKGNVYDRARHPKYVNEIDREHYVQEMLRCCEDLGVKVTLKEVQGALPSGRLHHAFERAHQEGLTLPEELVVEKGESSADERDSGGDCRDEKMILIKPIQAGELEWREKPKGIRRNVVRRRPAGQLALTIFTEETKEEEKISE